MAREEGQGQETIRGCDVGQAAEDLQAAAPHQTTTVCGARAAAK